MTPSEERKYLSAVLKQIDNGAPAWLQRAWVNVLLWFVVAALFLVLFQAGNKISPLVLALSGLMVGVAVGYFSILQCAARTWPMLRPHVTRESIVERLSALKP